MVIMNPTLNPRLDAMVHTTVSPQLQALGHKLNQVPTGVFLMVMEGLASRLSLARSPLSEMSFGSQANRACVLALFDVLSKVPHIA